MIGHSHRLRRIWRAAAFALAALIAFTGLALAAKPIKDAKYVGTLTDNSTESVTFKVNRTGTRVTGFKVTPFFPNACGAGGQPPQYSSKPAKIKNGRFHTTVSVKKTGGGKSPVGKANGKFLAKGKEKGSVKPVGLPQSCIKPFPYTTKATQ